MNKKTQTMLQKYRIKRNVILSSGQQSDHYYDIKSLLLNNCDWKLIENDIKIKIMKCFPNTSHIAGYGIGGILLATRLASSWYDINPLIIRNEKKEYGLTKQIEGNTSNIKKVIIVDDVCTTGQSLLKTKDILMKFDITSIDYFAICRRERCVFYCESYFKM